MSATLELTQSQFYPMLFAHESVTMTRVSATAFRFAGFLWSAVGDAATEDRSAWAGTQWQNYLSDPRCEFYAIYCDGEPAGCCELVRGPRLMRARGGVTRIKAFGLMPEYRGEGIGAAVLTRLVEKAFATGATRVSFRTKGEMSPTMLEVFSRQGFFEVGAEVQLRD